jgi:hypothetical protein
MTILGNDIIAGNTGNIYESYSIPFESGMPLITLIDFNNDGKVEILHFQKQNTSGFYPCILLYTNNGILYTDTLYFSLSSSPEKIFTSDFNHDGLTDLMVFSSSGYRIFYNQGGTSLQNMFVNSSTLNTGVTNHERMEMGDFNGDGIADFIWNDNNSANLYFEIGSANGTYSRHLAYTLGFNTCSKNKNDGTWSCMVVDLDHDGKSDVVLNLAKYSGIEMTYSETHTYWLLSNGTSLVKEKEATSLRKDDAKAGHLFAGDFKGNGYLEVANYGYDCYNGSNADTDPTVNIYSCSSQKVPGQQWAKGGLYLFFYDIRPRVYQRYRQQLSCPHYSGSALRHLTGQRIWRFSHSGSDQLHLQKTSRSSARSGPARLQRGNGHGDIHREINKKHDQ